MVANLRERFKDNTTVGVAYIYCNFRQQDKQGIGDLLASLVKQLAQGQSSLPGSVTDLYNRHKEKQTQPSFDEISRTLQSVAAIYSTVFIVVDALDECQVSNGCRHRFLAELFNLQVKCGANLFVTSRPISRIEKEFEGNTKLEIRASKEDVQRYLEGHMFLLPGFVNQNPELQKEIKTRIVKAIDGMYIFYFKH